MQAIEVEPFEITEWFNSLEMTCPQLIIILGKASGKSARLTESRKMPAAICGAVIKEIRRRERPDEDEAG
jgi:hypothetical protein